MSLPKVTVSYTPRITRRIFVLGSVVSSTLGWSRIAFGMDLSSISNQDAAEGIKGALEQGASTAVSLLGASGGFLNNPKVKIPLPSVIDKAQSVLRMMGRGKDADDLVVAMNHAAEQAVPAAKDLLVEAVKSMSVSDAKAILTGGDESATQFFKSKTEAPLHERFLPIVKQVTDRAGLAQQYNKLAGEGAKMGVVKPDEVTVEQYVTTKALDGLYTIIGDQEKALRQNPAAAGSAMVSKVFGALK